MYAACQGTEGDLGRASHLVAIGRSRRYSKAPPPVYSPLVDMHLV